MGNIKLKGNDIHTIGTLPSVGSKAVDFKLVNNELGEVSFKDFEGSRLILNIYPSVDTGICAMSTKRFNAEASKLSNTKILCISRDLPFAFSRYCGAEGLKEVVTLSDFRYLSFGKDYQVEIIDGPLKGLLSRAIVVLDQNRKVLYTEQVPEITQEPNYELAMKVLK